MLPALASNVISVVSALFSFSDAFRYSSSSASVGTKLEIHAHRGGMGMRSEASLWAFANAMDIGVDTLEMDVLFTSDGVPVIWHDHDIPPEKCSGKYVGQFIANLTFAQVQTMDCSVPLTDFPEQQLYPNTRIPSLNEVLDLIHCYNDSSITITLETKLDPLAHNETLAIEHYVTDLIPVLEAHNFLHRTSIQSFDWRTLIAIHEVHPHVELVALLDEKTTSLHDPRNSIVPYPWLGGLNFSLFNGDWVAAAAHVGAKVVSPVHGDPPEGSIYDADYVQFTFKTHTARAKELGMKVIPWTVDCEGTIARMLDEGVDGIISNYPERVRKVARERGLTVTGARSGGRSHCLISSS